MSEKNKILCLMNHMKRGWRIWALAGIFGLLLGNTQCMAAENIYIAGIPDAWPLEFYDKDSGSYQGVVPDMLREAGEAAGISISYIHPSEEDMRLELAKNVQVDAVCTLGLDSQALAQAGLEEGSIFFTYIEDGVEKKAALAYSKSMETADRESLEKALKGLDEKQIRNRILYYALREKGGNHFWEEYGFAFLIAFAVVIVLLIAVSWKFSRKKKRIEQLAYQDDVTGKNNFTDWKRKWNQIVADGNRELYAVTFLSGGIDVISHIYGYEEAEYALKLFSDVCAEWIVPEKENFARFNEYYFVFSLQFMNVQELKARIYRLYETLEYRFREENKKYFLELNMGIYKLSNVDTDSLKTVQYSEVAAEYAKTHFLKAVVYNEMVEKDTISGYAMEHEAVNGLIHQEFILYLQPILDIKTGKIYGAEALVRWKNPNRGLLSPGEFLDIMKKKQLLSKMDLEIYKQGCRFLQKEQKCGNDIHLMFNFTTENMKNEQFADILKVIAEENRIKTNRILLQLNLDDAGEESEVYWNTVRRLKEAGFEIWLSGLELNEVLFRFLEHGVRGIKLGYELIGQIKHPKGRKVIGNVVALCQELKLKVLCVGAEDEAQAQSLKQLGCELVSGKHFYYPVTPEGFGELLESVSEPDREASII